MTARLVFFRFYCAYLVLYCSRDNVFASLPGASFLTKRYTDLWHAVCPWVGSHLFHLSGRAITYVPTGSGDTTLDYIENFLVLLIALAAAAVWSVLDRKRDNYRGLEPWLRLLVRYTLAFTLFNYGFAKIFPLQFRPPGLSKLIEPYGDFSPMGVLWNFMGASTAYIVFAGASEVLPGLLLLFRRTTTLGALIAFSVLLNVMVLNFCYDVPVKLFSTNLVLMAVYLAAGDLRRLANVLLFNRATAPVDESAPRFTPRWARVSALVFQILFVGYTLATGIYGGWTGYQTAYVYPQRPPIYGVYEVVKFTRNGQEVPPLATDSSRWRRLIAEFPDGIVIKMMNDRTEGYAAAYNDDRKTLTLTKPRDSSVKYELHYAQPDPGRLTLDGTIRGDLHSIRMRKIELSKYPLVSRGFHWINEAPFNR